MEPQIDNADLYRDIRERTVAMLRAHGGDGTGSVRCCPEWTITQVASHTAGVCADILAGNIGAAGTDPWTAAQVEARTGRTLTEVLDEWDELGPRVEAALAGGAMPDQLVFDTVSHEQDLRGALDQPGARDGPALLAGLRFLLDALDESARSAGLPALRIVTGPHDRVVGDGEPAATLTVAPFEFLRSFTGRRSVEQVGSLDWGGADPTPWTSLLRVGPFSPSPDPVVE